MIKAKRTSGKLSIKPRNGAHKHMTRVEKISSQPNNGDNMLRNRLNNGASKLREKPQTGDTQPMIKARKTSGKPNNGANKLRREP